MTSVSVVMAVYNGRRYLKQQVDSILEQLLPGDELVVIDDASTDGSREMLLDFPSTLLRLHTNAVNMGVRKTFELGLGLARHDMIFLADQDDIWKSGKRAAYVAAFASNSAPEIVISDSEVIDSEGKVTEPSFMATRGGFNGTLLGTVWRNRYLGCAMALRRSVLDVALPIPANVPQHDIWLGAIGRWVGHVTFLPTPYLQYRRHAANVTPLRRQGWLQMARWRTALIRAIVGRVVSMAMRKRCL